MKKKFLAFLLALCFIVPSALVFSACSSTEEEKVNNYKITVIQSTNGLISPDFTLDSNTMELTEGSSYTFYVAANEGYRIANLIIDGKVVPASSTYTFSNIKDNHTISANFELEKVSKTLAGIKINFKNDVSEDDLLKALSNALFEDDSYYVGNGNKYKVTHFYRKAYSTTNSTFQNDSLILNHIKTADNGYDFIYNDNNSEETIVNLSNFHEFSVYEDSKVNQSTFYIDLTNKTSSDILFYNGSAKIEGSLEIQYEIGYEYYYYNELKNSSTRKESITINLDKVLNLSDIRVIETAHYDDLNSLNITVENLLFNSVELIFE